MRTMPILTFLSSANDGVIAKMLPLLAYIPFLMVSKSNDELVLRINLSKIIEAIIIGVSVALIVSYMQSDLKKKVDRIYHDVYSAASVEGK